VAWVLAVLLGTTVSVAEEWLAALAIVTQVHRMPSDKMIDRVLNKLLRRDG
jgi:hypothetical protein